MGAHRLAVIALTVATLLAGAGCERERGATGDGARAPTTSRPSVPSEAAIGSTSSLTSTARSTTTTPFGSRPATTQVTTPFGSRPATTQVAAPTTTAGPGACTAGLTVRETAALVTWPAVVTDDWGAARHVVGELGVGGVLLMMPGDDVSRDDLTARLDELDRLGGRRLLVATDEEGGNVQRLRRYRPLPSQREVSRQFTPDAASELIAEHGAFVSDIGVDVVFGPVVDIAPLDGDPALDGSRFFEGGPAEVAEFAAAYVDGWSATGLLPTLKHFPGHGSASTDTHDALGTTPPLDQLAARDLIPYLALAAQPVAVMVGHLDVPGLTDSSPASSSSAAIDFLRDDVGFVGALVFSDALDMGAVELPLPDAAVASIDAGVDVVLFSDTSATADVIDALVAAVEDGRLPEDRMADAADRVLRHAGDPACDR